MEQQCFRTSTPSLLYIRGVLTLSKPDYSIPALSDPAAPILGSDSTNTYQDFITETLCADKYNPKPTVPYGLQDTLYSNTSLYTEEGYKKVRGDLTEGRYLTFEADGAALTNPQHGTSISATETTSNHKDIRQRWVLHEADADTTRFTISSAVDGRYITMLGTLTSTASEAHTFIITNLGGSKGYTVQTLTGLYISLSEHEVFLLSIVPTAFSLYSVTYAS